MKLYEKKSYLKENDTVITECRERDGKFWVRLEDTIFFPEEGGQYGDTGTVTAGSAVKEKEEISVVETVHVADSQLFDGQVWHRVDRILSAGTKVHCRLDWDKRFMRMQQHSGEHILTGVIHNHFGYNNVGFHLSDDAPVTLDLNGVLTREQIIEMEQAANDVVYRNIPIVDSYPSREELNSIEYRSKIEIEGQVRLITVGTGDEVVDVCACCAPHVSMTGAVGIIKVISAQNYKGGMRLNILCGRRALEYIQGEHQTMNRLANTFSTSADKVLTCVEGKIQEAADARLKLAEYVESDLIRQINDIPVPAGSRQAEGAEPDDGNEKGAILQNACIFTASDITAATMKNCYNAMTERFSGYVGIFAGNDENGYRFNAGSRTKDSRKLMALMKETLNARGGGSAEMVQGSVKAAREAIEKLFL
ncbi:MAG: alanyl-tRNA editing protein [Parasporobacterium sp.]|nr:alanyl-tRNA editing protein [Parasporobacterium sp.]